MDQRELDELLKANPDLRVDGGERPVPARAVETQTWTVNIQAYGKARPRVTQNGQHTYMPAAYEAWKGEFLASSPTLRVSPPYGVKVLIVRAIPKSGANRTQRVGAPCVTKPDGDNVIGSVMDALLGDDSAVVEGAWRKVWGMDHALRVTVWHIADGRL